MSIFRRNKNKKDIQISLNNESKGWKSSFALAVSLIIILPLVFAVTPVIKNFLNLSEEEKELYSEFENYGTQIINENTPEGKVAGEETEMSIEIDPVLSSESFRVSDINVGGDIMVLAKEENGPLEIRNIKSESFIGKKDEAKLIISWQTNKLAVSELNYSKSNGQNPETLKENSYGFVHSAMVSNLDPGTPYVYSIKTRDRWSNEKESDFFGVYTSQKPVSVFDLISEALNEVFGWAINNS